MAAITAKVLCATIIASPATFDVAAANEACKNAKYVIEAAEKHNVNPYFLTALISVESNWRPKVVSRSNACGLTQIIPKYSKYTCEQLKTPKTSIFAGAKLLSYWTNVYGKGDVETGLCGYLSGYTCGKAKQRKSVLTYVKKVARIAASLKIKGENQCLSTYCF